MTATARATATDGGSAETAGAVFPPPTPPTSEASFTTGGDRLLAIITSLYLAGRAVQLDDENFHRARIAWEWRSGQWVMLTDDHRLMGWMSWYRVDDAALTAIREQDRAALVALGPPDETLTAGRHLHFATVAVVPGAPADAFIRLCRMGATLNADAETVSWHRYSRRGGPRFVLRGAGWQNDGMIFP